MDSFALIIFGITSNLAQIKLIPALYDMAEKGLLPENVSIIGSARKPQSPEEFRDYIISVLKLENKHHQHPIDETVLQTLLSKMHYVDGQLDDPNFYQKLESFLDQLSSEGKGCDNRIFYLATYPDLYQSIFENLKESGLSNQNNGWVRLMIEKPIGNDLESAKKLNKLLDSYFDESQIYRLDHYLGKETLQNILTFRFGNDIFEPLINKEYVDHIQITATEDFGIGMRGGYFDKVGMLKDTGQNHQLQMLAFATMESPAEFSNRAVTDSRIEILKNLQPIPEKVVFGQYEGYKMEPNVDPDSQIDTYYALKTFINNDRFRDVPIYIRAGKKLKQTVTEISIVFKNHPNRLFKDSSLGDQPNVLIYRIQPNEGIVVKIVTKKPSHEVELEPEYMQFCYRLDPQSHSMPDPYEKLIADTIRGDQTFFNDAEEVEAQWKFIDPLVKSSQSPEIYPVGSWGPSQADELIEADGRKWLEPSMEFCRI